MGTEVKEKSMIRKIVLKIPYIHPSLNVILNMHWAERSKERDLCFIYISNAFVEGGLGNLKKKENGLNSNYALKSS